MNVVYIDDADWLTQRASIKCLGVVAMVSNGDNAASPPTPSDALVEALRELVREELKRPAPSKIHERPPTWRDGFWLLVFVVNVVLLAALIPEKWWNDPALEIVGKVLPWLGGGTLILGATWFHERLLAFSRSRTFMVMMASGLVPLLLLQVRFIHLKPKIEPLDSHFYVDGDKPKEEGPFDGQHAIKLRLRNHTFKIEPHDSGGQIQERPPIEWGWRHLLGAWWGNLQPQWALIYPLTITTDGEGCTVHIRKSDKNEQLDTDFYDERLKRVDDYSLEFKPKDTAETISLPMGKYTFSEENGRCHTPEPPDPKAPAPVDVPSQKAFDLGTMECPTK